jgi:hypothetical protein
MGLRIVSEKVLNRYKNAGYVRKKDMSRIFSLYFV